MCEGTLSFYIISSATKRVPWLPLPPPPLPWLAVSLPCLPCNAFNKNNNYNAVVFVDGYIWCVRFDFYPAQPSPASQPRPPAPPSAPQQYMN